MTNERTIASTTYYRLATDDPRAERYIAVPKDARKLVRFLESPKAERPAFAG